MISDAKLCEMSGQVYDDALISGEVDELEYQICPRDDEYVLTIRGTDINSWWDIRRDLNMIPVKHPVFGWCHRGFARGADALFNEISPKINNETELVLNGHSLGGIESMMLGINLDHHGFKVRRWVGFGTPHGFLGRVELPFPGRAYVHGGDVVSMIPTWPYRHPANIEIVRVGSGWLPSVSDHHITDGYLESIQEAL